MDNKAWDRDGDTTQELWDRFIWLLAQRLCQSRGLVSQGRSSHIRNPAEHNDPCEPCYFELADIVDPDLCEAIGIVGSVAYRLCHDGLPESDVAARALGQMVDDLIRKEESKKLFAEMGGTKAWSKLALEVDERASPYRDEDGEDP